MTSVGQRDRKVEGKGGREGEQKQRGKGRSLRA